MNSLKNELLKFELTGAKAHAVVYSALKIARTVRPSFIVRTYSNKILGELQRRRRKGICVIEISLQC